MQQILMAWRERIFWDIFTLTAWERRYFEDIFTGWVTKGRHQKKDAFFGWFLFKLITKLFVGQPRLHQVCKIDPLKTLRHYKSRRTSKLHRITGTLPIDGDASGTTLLVCYSWLLAYLCLHIFIVVIDEFHTNMLTTRWNSLLFKGKRLVSVLVLKTKSPTEEHFSFVECEAFHFFFLKNTEILSIIILHDIYTYNLLQRHLATKYVTTVMSEHHTSQCSRRRTPPRPVLPPLQGHLPPAGVRPPQPRAVRGAGRRARLLPAGQLQQARPRHLPTHWMEVAVRRQVKEGEDLLHFGDPFKM